MNEYTKKAVIELENGNYKGYQFYMNLNRRNRSDRQAIRDKWDHEQTRFIKKNYQTMRDEEMAVSLGRTIEAVRCQRKK